MWRQTLVHSVCQRSLFWALGINSYIFVSYEPQSASALVVSSVGDDDSVALSCFHPPSQF